MLHGETMHRYCFYFRHGRTCTKKKIVVCTIDIAAKSSCQMLHYLIRNLHVHKKCSVSVTLEETLFSKFIRLLR